MPTLADDLQAVLNLKATHFKGKTYTAWSDTDLAAYQQTRTVPQKKRGEAVLEQWDDYLNERLAPLVREAVPEAINLSKQMRLNSVDERKRFVESCISDWIIEPACGQTRWWFMFACDGKSVVMDAARTKGPTWKESIDAWALPRWLNPYSKLEDGAALFIRDRQNALRERLQYVCREEIGTLADHLLMPLPGPNEVVTGRQDETCVEPRTFPAVARKLDSPDAFPTMSVPECEQVFNCSRSTVLRWVEDGKLERVACKSKNASRKPGKQKILISTLSVSKQLKAVE